MSILQSHKAFWGPIAELVERARLVSKGIGLKSEKMTDRLVRYYSAQGVLDKPDRLGRDAAYNFRHLLQLLTARRLSANGISLEAIGRHNLSTTTEQLEAGLLKPVQVEAYASAQKTATEISVTSTKAFAGSPVAMIDVLSEVQALKYQLAKDREELIMMRSELGELATNFKELRYRLENVTDGLDMVVQLVKTGLNTMHQSEDKFAYIVEKQLRDQNEKYNYLTEYLERIEKALYKIEFTSGQGK
jgi:DNA-binding transcriptional MerR regulator